MKALTLFVVLLATASANASHYKCTEKAADAVAKNRLQYSVFITTLAEIKDRRVVGQHDRADKVRVSLLSRNPKVASSRFALARPSFEAVAKSEDVMFQIDARKNHGFQFNMYLDELDQTSMNLSGIRGSIRLSCSSNE